MSTSIKSVAESVATEFVGSRKMFTAYDVTKECRARGHFAKHDAVRDAVHDAYNRGVFGIDYEKTNITVPGGATPVLYHPKTDDPDTYTGVVGGSAPASAGSTSSSPNPGSITVPSFDDDDDDDDDEDEDDDEDDDGGPGPYAGTFQQLPPVGLTNGSATKKAKTNHGGVLTASGGVTGKGVDNRKTLLIPAPVVSGIGFKPHTKVNVCTDPVFPGYVIVTTNPTVGNRQVVGKYTVNKGSHIRINQGTLAKAGLGGQKYDVETVGGELKVKLA